VASMMRPGDVLAGRYRLVVLLNERSGGRFWRAWDEVLARHVAIHLIRVEDDRADLLKEAARRSATVHDPHLLRVLDTDVLDGFAYVVNEWGEGVSLNNLVVDGPLPPRRAAWLVAEVGEMVARAHASGVAHGRLVPENVLLDESGSVKVIGFAVDAALHGLPSGREGADVVDLAGLLYTALTGKWTGVSDSTVPPAPLEHGRPLRPRQVRAGVPRVLDTVCDEVLGSHVSAHGYTSARAIVDALVEYIGDPAGVAATEAARARGNTNPRLPRITAPVAEPEPTQALEPQPEPTPTPERGPEPDAPVGEETQAGVPVFDDDVDDISWMKADPEPPPPPPPFEEEPTRPLFAPDPPDGSPARTPRTPPPEDTGDFWPWGGSEERSPIVEDTSGEDDETVPGRSWMRIAGILSACVVVLLAMVYAFNRGHEGGGPDGEEPGPDATTGAGTTRIQVVAVDDFDPLGEPSEENPDQVTRSADGDRTTFWPTQTYREQLGPEGLKTGVGLLLDLGGDQQVGRVTVTVVGGATSAELRVSDAAEAPSSEDELDVVATGTSADGVLDLRADSPVTARWVVVWLTGLPTVPGGFRGEVAEVVVRS